MKRECERRPSLSNQAAVGTALPLDLIPELALQHCQHRARSQGGKRVRHLASLDGSEPVATDIAPSVIIDPQSLRGSAAGTGSYLQSQRGYQRVALPGRFRWNTPLRGHSCSKVRRRGEDAMAGLTPYLI